MDASPLKWSVMMAETQFGRYNISADVTTVGLFLDSVKIGNYKSVSAAEEAAQADFEQRFRSSH